MNIDLNALDERVLTLLNTELPNAISKAMPSEEPPPDFVIKAIKALNKASYECGFGIMAIKGKKNFLEAKKFATRLINKTRRALNKKQGDKQRAAMYINSASNEKYKTEIDLKELFKNIAIAEQVISQLPNN